jgi:protein-export membrane protein SecD/preprotein translocase SecF subunit
MKRQFAKVGLIVLVALLLGFISLPATQQKSIIPFTPDWILNNKINLGLDLQGGSQLDYKIDLRNVALAERASIVEGIVNVINKRVNGLGVSEPNIYTSDVAEEKHLIVELAGIKDLEQAKQIVGKTIQLEFKEEKSGTSTSADTEKEAAAVKATAQTLLDKINAGGDIKVLGQEEAQSNPAKVLYGESKDFQFKDQVPATLAEELFKLTPGKTLDRLIDNSGNYSIDGSGQLTQGKPGYSIIQVTDKQDQEREITTPKQITVRHILIAYKGAQKVNDTITRTEEQAKKLADEILVKLQGGTSFDEMAKQFSDDATSKDKGGLLDRPVQNDSYYAKEFEDTANATPSGQLSQVFKSPFGFHIIKTDSVTEAKTEKKIEPQVKYIQVYYDATPDPWQTTGLNGQHFVHADVEFNQLYQPYVSIKFNDEGAKLFEEITGRNVGKPLAIFVGGQQISAPNVDEKISGGSAQINGQFTVDEANGLARDLNTGAIPAPIVLSGQYTIGATLGQDALEKSLFAGLLGFLLVALFMVIFYRLPGFLAVIALSVYCAILIFLIKIALPIGLALAISVAVFVVLITTILKSRDSGAEKAISLILACFILFFLSYILSSSVVMTLAGIAGVILSIGMAVDANILIFERVKEELRDGRSLGAAIEVGFDRAWNSIRDSNFSSLITCGILFYFGSSIIQGFAFNLAAGILVSMFTAITVSKTLISALVNTKLAQNLWLFGAPKNKERKILPIVQKRKFVYVISLTLLVISLLGIPLFGLKAGLDFTGGTLMEFKFSNLPESAKLQEVMQKSAETVNNALGTNSSTASAITTPVSAVPASATSTTTPAATTTGETTLETTETKIDFAKIHIIPAESGYIVKTSHISTTAHDLLIAEMKKTFADLEETRFSTVGPTVGSSMQYRAILAVILASVMIILYIAFAFRRVPRHIGKWRFGVTAIIALLHDLGIMLGVYVYLGYFLGVEIDALFITALLTILGFSVHDTIVVFDRIREKLKYQKKDESFEDVANQAVNETMQRSINTSLSVALTLLALVIFGSESIRYFVLSLLVGIVAGTYSSIFVATPLLVDWHNYNKSKKLHK